MYLKFVLVCCFIVICTARKLDIGVGIPEPNFSPRIVGGSDALKGEFPHQISLQWRKTHILKHMCGGSIINSQWILTAAHCPTGVTDQLYVKAGKLLIANFEKTEQLRKVEKIFIHDKYPSCTSPYDIALLKLEKPFIFNTYVQPIKLPSQNYSVEGEVILSGWGSTSGTNVPSMPNTLQKAKLLIIDLEACNKALTIHFVGSQAYETNICTGPLYEHLASCNGDSGGPLIKVHDDGLSEVVGIVSWGFFPCGSLGAPSIYTKVSAFIDWIDSIINNN